MLTLIISLIGASITIWLTPNRLLWPTLTSQTSIFLLLGFITLLSPILVTNHTTWGLTGDLVSIPLILLRLWLVPVSLLSSVGHLQNKSPSNTRLFIQLTLLILISLIITFSATNFIIFFLGFEGTLIPTLFLISRWGAQQERIEAGYYFVFYTLIRSLPLFIGLIYYYINKNHLSITRLGISSSGNSTVTLALCCIAAFLVKVPIFTLHLWLPKAHVEAPVAGSMILAAILLKMGGYGFIRLVSLFFIPFKQRIAPLLIPFCCWGGLLTSLICLTQTDLKSLVAYSSVSHMSFMIAGVSTLKNWSIRGSIIIMIAHGLVSSALFCLAKVFYERTGTRTLAASRGIKTTLLILPLMWLTFACAKMGLPPLPKAIGELFIFSSIIRFSVINYIPTLAGILLTGVFRLRIYQIIKTGSNHKWKTIKGKVKEREYSTLRLHFLPLIALVLFPGLISI